MHRLKFEVTIEVKDIEGAITPKHFEDRLVEAAKLFLEDGETVAVRPVGGPEEF
jgi:hypothetical protein